MLPWRLIEAPLSTFVYAAFETMSELHEQPRLNRFPSLLLHQHAAGLDCFWSMWILVLSQLQVAEATFFSGEVAVCVLSVTVKRICVCCLLSFDAVEGAVTAVIRCSKEKHSPPPQPSLAGVNDPVRNDSGTLFFCEGDVLSPHFSASGI